MYHLSLAQLVLGLVKVLSCLLEARQGSQIPRRPWAFNSMQRTFPRTSKKHGEAKEPHSRFL